jgi:hypothetical protein
METGRNSSAKAKRAKRAVSPLFITRADLGGFIMEENTKRGIEIVAGIANVANKVGQTFTMEQLNELLSLFGQHPSNDDRDYVWPKKLVLWTYREYYDKGDSTTAEIVRKVFPWFDPKADLSLLDQ